MGRFKQKPRVCKKESVDSKNCAFAKCVQSNMRAGVNFLLATRSISVHTFSLSGSFSLGSFFRWLGLSVLHPCAMILRSATERRLYLLASWLPSWLLLLHLLHSQFGCESICAAAVVGAALGWLAVAFCWHITGWAHAVRTSVGRSVGRSSRQLARHQR